MRWAARIASLTSAITACGWSRTRLPGEPQHRPTEEDQVVLPWQVPCSHVIPQVNVAVALDRDPPSGVRQIEFGHESISIEHSVMDDRLWEPSVSEKTEDQELHVCVGHLGPVCILQDHSAETSCAVSSLARMSGQCLDERRPRHELGATSGLHRACQPLPTDVATEVEDHPVGIGDGKTCSDDDLAAVEIGALVNTDPVPSVAAPSRDAELDGGPSVARHAPNPRRGQVGGDGPGTGGEDRCQLERLPVSGRPCDEVHPAVHSFPPPPCDALGGVLGASPCCPHVGQGDEHALPRGNAGQ